jgi:hypothetical protein
MTTYTESPCVGAARGPAAGNAGPRAIFRRKLLLSNYLHPELPNGQESAS